MQCMNCRIPDVKILTPERVEDERGWLMECYQEDVLHFYGIREHFVQENHVYTKKAGTVRGLHFQVPPCAQSKLVRCTTGESVHAVVDIRPESDTFGQWVMGFLTAENGRLLYIPKGFAHGYLTRTDHVEVQYRLDMPYIPQAARSLYYADRTVGIPWKVHTPLLSEKDSRKHALSWEAVVKML